MANIFEFNASKRDTHGTSAARRMRRLDERVPAVVYGAGKDTTSISLGHNELALALRHEAIYSHILTLNVDGQAEKVVFKAIDRHPSRPRILHVDFLRVSDKEKLTMHVPLHFLGEENAPGVEQGGIFSKAMSDLVIKCLPADLPEHIDLDVSRMGLNDILHISDIKLPKGVELAMHHLDEAHDHPVISLHTARVEVEPVEEAPAAEEAEAAEGEEAIKAEGAEDKSEE